MALFGLLPDAKASAPPIIGGAFDYGGHQVYDKNGNLVDTKAQAQAAQYGQQADFYQEQANNIRTRVGAGNAQGQAAVDSAGKAAQQAGIIAGGGNQARGEQMQSLADQRNAAAALGMYAQQPQGPSAAAAQLKAGADLSFQQQLAMARSGTGSSGGAAALRGAAFQQAGIMGQANQQAAQVRAQEDQAYKQRQLDALNAQQLGYGAAAGTAGNVRGADLSSAQNQAQTVLNGGSLQAQTNLGFAQQRNQQGGMNDAAVNQLNQLGLQYDELGNVVTQDQLQADMNHQALRSGQAMQTNMFNAGVSNQSNQQDIQTAGMIAGAAMLMSDTREKKDIEREKGAAEAFAALGGQPSRARRDFETYQGAPDATASLGVRRGSAGSPFASYDRDRGEAFTRQLASRNAEATALGYHPPGADLRSVPNYSYRYRDPATPGAAPGRQVGPMAQDLEANPTTAHLVHDTPNGKMVDTGRAAMLALPAIGEQQRRIDALEQAQALGMPPRNYGGVDLSALDDAYARERAYR